MYQLICLAFTAATLAAINAHVIPVATSQTSSTSSSSSSEDHTSKSNSHHHGTSSVNSNSIHLPSPPSSSNKTSIPQIHFTFPPMHCTEDIDCIGRNATSRVFFDPYARCDRSRGSGAGVCACRDGYRRMQFKVKTTRGRRSSVSNNAQSTNTNQSATPIYISKCVHDIPSSASNPSNELTVFLRSLHYYGQNCDTDKQCAANLICRQLVPGI